MTPAAPLHVVHLLYSFSIGGMENVVVQLINRLPPSRFRHTVVALTQADAAFAGRVENEGTRVVEMHKPPGQPFAFYPAMYRLFRQLRPDVLHTCNLAAMEFAPVAALAGVPLRVHAEHGWDVADPDGSNTVYRWSRRFYRPFIQQFVTVSAQLDAYFRNAVRVPSPRLQLIANGVDTGLFRPAQSDDPMPEGFPFRRPEHWTIGTVGRLATIKNQTLLAEAFVRLVQSAPPRAEALRLAIVGDGDLARPIRDRLQEAGLADRLWLPGNRGDVPDVLRRLDCFVLPSLAEGTSCSLQEAMATALPIVATDVGGNRDLLDDGALGDLVPSGDADTLAASLRRVFMDPEAAMAKARAARRVIENRYGLAAVADRYAKLFGG